jgi:hypothetical protein
VPLENVAGLSGMKYQGIIYKHGIGANPVFFGAEPGHPYLKELLDRYWEYPDDYAVKAAYCDGAPIAPPVWSSVMERYGLRYINKEQHLAKGIHILTDEKFRHLSLSDDRTGLKALHLACNSWVRNNNKHKY